MKNSYNQVEYFALSEHKEAFLVMLEVFVAFAIRFFLIGAQARDVHFFQKGIKSGRITKDVDFAVMIESIERYQDLMRTLVQEGFESTKYPYRLVWKNGQTILDLLPFGQIEENHTVNFDQREVELSVLGYSELSEELRDYFIDKEQTISIPLPPLHGIFMLKLLSWDDSKPNREKDLLDLSQILHLYWEFVEEEAYEKHLDLFGDNFDLEKAAARILGRHLNKTSAKSPKLRQKICFILNEQLVATDPPGLLLRKIASEQDKSIEAVGIILSEIIAGINE